MIQKILDNVEEYSAEELVVFIREGIVTFDILVQETNGDFAASKRREVKQLLERGDINEWEKVQQERTIDAVQRYLDMYPDGEFREQARSLKMLLEDEIQKNCLNSKAEEAWAILDKNNLDSLRLFISSYPNSGHVNEANAFILDVIMGVGVETLVSQIRQYQTDRSLTPAQKNNNIIDSVKNYLEGGKISKKDFLNKFKEDYNLFNAGVVKNLISKKILALDDLIAIGIDRLFIEKMSKGEVAYNFSKPEELKRIYKQSTEIYFWGIPSSGKSCALGAILSVAGSGRIAKSMDLNNKSQGYGYMTKLMNLFQEGDVGALIGDTPIDQFYEMGFDLVDMNEKIHPITCIDMAGELMRCMYKSDAGDIMNQKEICMLDTLTNVLVDNRSVNRKMHFFVIEYGAEDRLYEGLPQKVYLNGALSYIKSTGIFRKDTDAIFIMITKTDKVKNATKDTFAQYINDKYLGFVNGLEQICKDNEINKGRVEKIAFSLGEVCFQNYCRFNSRPAENVVNIILQRTASCGGGKIGKLQKIFSR